MIEPTELSVHESSNVVVKGLKYPVIFSQNVHKINKICKTKT